MYTQQGHYFLGANTPNGFYSLYDELIDLRASDTLYIIKGGPGSGKSSFMKEISKAMVENDIDVEYIHCSGDPDSLDAISMPALGVAYVDGTSPHVIDAKYPGVMEEYLNFSSFYNNEELKKHKEEVIEINRTYKSLYARAYNCISAAWGVINETNNYVLDDDIYKAIHKRSKGIISREISKSGSKKPGKKVKRFLTGITCKGLVNRFDTIDILAEKVYELDNELGLAHYLLSDVAAAAINAGRDVILCPSPMDPDKLEHIIIPDLSLAFVSTSRSIQYEGVSYRHIRLDAMADGDKLKGYKQRIRFSRKTFGLLMQDATDTLADAKKLHDELEAIYNPYVDFTKVYDLAKSHTKLLLDKKANLSYIN